MLQFDTSLRIDTGTLHEFFCNKVTKASYMLLFFSSSSHMHPSERMYVAVCFRTKSQL